MLEDGYVEGMPVVAELSAWRDRTGEERRLHQEWGRKFCEVWRDSKLL